MLNHVETMADLIVRLDPNPVYSEDRDLVDLAELATMLQRTGPVYLRVRSNLLSTDGVLTTYEAVLEPDGKLWVWRQPFLDRMVRLADGQRVIADDRVEGLYHGARLASEVAAPNR